MKIELAQLEAPHCTLAYTLWEPVGVTKGNVVAVHGLVRQKRDFDFFADYLAQQGYRIFALDMPGRGGSSRFENSDDYRNDVYADVMRAFLKQQGLTSVHWIGTSMGGLIALEMARQGHGDLFQSLTLVDITHKPNHTACVKIADSMSEKFPILHSIQEQIDFTKKYFPFGDISENAWKHFAIHQFIETNEGYTFHYDPKLVRRAQRDLRSTIDLTGGLEKLKCPVALVAGEISDLCTKNEILDLKSTRPDVAIHICPKAGHTPALTDKATQRFIQQFMSGKAVLVPLSAFSP